ncbi:DUF4199 domain-containing protein [Mucilaginibacter lappiensis]|uniref:DUF4199 domain-containing protein n=1 Tax=Mucilaginibacter lappiensis TaxID=354630 RepID=UPI003D23ABB3
MIENTDQQIRKKAIPNGVVLGVALSIFSICSFYFMISMGASVVLMTSAPVFFSLILPLAAAALLCFNLRKRIGGYWSFKQAATGIFVMFIVAFVVQFLLRDLLFAKVIEPNMMQKTETAMVNSVSTYLHNTKVSQENIDKKIADIKKEFDTQKDLSIGKQIQGLGFNIIFMFVFAVIFAAMFKKERPVYNPGINDPAV